MNRCLVIQPAYPGDAILALPVLQRLRQTYPSAELHFVVRDQVQSLFETHPAIDHLSIWKKSSEKLKHFWHLVKKLKTYHFDLVINLHRFFLSGLLGSLVPAKERRCFRKNPLASLYHRSFPHVIGQPPFPHEVERNLMLLEGLCPTFPERPMLFIPSDLEERLEKRIFLPDAFIVFAPGSVWKTKQWPIENWKALARELSCPILVIGGNEDRAAGEAISEQDPKRVINLCGHLSFLESAAVIKRAKGLVCHDSAPMHLASGVNCPTIAIFCSTVPEFGFGPLSDQHRILQTHETLPCRPCGLHGHRRCPKGHFRCASTITVAHVKKAIEEIVF